jgi:hypothetical protein
MLLKYPKYLTIEISVEILKPLSKISRTSRNFVDHQKNFLN